MKRVRSIILTICLATVAMLFLSERSKAQIDPGDQVDAFLNPAFPTNFLFHGAGARALGMGYAYTAMSDDITALTWNPAGLLGIEKPTLGLEYRRVGGKADITSPNGTEKFSESLSSLHFMSFGMQIRMRNQPFGVGLVIDRPVQELNEFRFSRSIQRDNSPFDGVDTILSEYSSITTSSSKDNIIRVTTGFGTRISGPLSMGLSLTFYSGKGSHDNLNFYRLENYLDPTSGLGDGIQEVLLQPVLGIIDTSTYSGTSLQIGFRYVVDKVKLAATVRPQHKMRFSFDYQLENTTYVNGIPTIGFGGVIHRDDQVSDIEIPMIITLGGAMDITPDVTIAADFESRSFGSSTYDRRIARQILSGDDLEVFQTVDPFYQNAISFRLGGEYWLTRLTDQSPGFALRAGFGSEDLAAPDLKIIPTNDTTALTELSKRTATSFSIGTGVWWSQIHLDAGISFTSFTRETDAVVPDVFGNIQQGVTEFSIVPIEYKASYPTFRLTFTGVF